jgi:catalase (peroxidase I)
VPLKEKYGQGLSWGDLIVLTGTVAIEHMGGPWAGFCAGRVDDDNGRESEPLGPGAKQESLWPCGGPGNPNNGSCAFPLGANTVGLIYVNPEGPLGVPDPVASAPVVREVFGRMTMNDSETVALIGGGHTFGKGHGACPQGAGKPPNEDPENPWNGTCGTGMGGYATTGGFEGPWTSHPTQWDNDYFKYLLNFSWTNATGPGGHQQWHVADGESPQAPQANNTNASQNVMMMTTDISLIKDEAYKTIVQKFATDLDAFSVRSLARSRASMCTHERSDSRAPSPHRLPLALPGTSWSPETWAP